MYSDVVLGVDRIEFEEIMDEVKDENGAETDLDLTAENLKEISELFKAKVSQMTGKSFPEDVKEQLWGAIRAVFDSWMNDRAISYRKMYDIPEEWGTAVNIQSMVFGNMGENCATGVAFTRNPSTGENNFYGEYLINAQGEDVVAGIRTPQDITIKGKEENGSHLPAMEETMPNLYKELLDTYHKLEKHYRDMQDMEFTIENGKLWMLQTRAGKRTAKASLKIACDMVAEGLITKEEAIMRIDPSSLDQLLHKTIDPSVKLNVIAKGLPASPGAGAGKIVFSAQKAQEWAENGEDVILVRIETSPEDINGMYNARAILTARGGMTSHAAVVARGMGRACISGAGKINIDYTNNQFETNGKIYNEGDIITINGSTGEVIEGFVKMIEPELSGDFETIMQYAKEIKRMKVRTNAETANDSKVALKFGAEGIGLCRTEHMFFEGDRINHVRNMILADNDEAKKNAIDKLLPYQKSDFAEIFNVMDGLPVNIRLLDPPLHEFLPHTDADFIEVAKICNVNVDELKSRARALSEENPMLGHRGCRLGISHPEIYKMQAKAIFMAVKEARENGANPIAEIMIPLVMNEKELKILKADIKNIMQEIIGNEQSDTETIQIETAETETIQIGTIQIGTMIELPRACIIADKIAEDAEYFSFGTNDLTQTTLGISRDDAGHFLGEYIDHGIFEKDPFTRLDIDGVGELMKMAVEKGRKTRPDIKLGICGEHGGDPYSIKFCEEIGLDYVSSSPYRVPIAIIASAQATIKNNAK